MLTECKDKTKLKSFIEEVELKEYFNYEAEYIFADIEDGKILGLVAYMMDDYDGGRILPRYVHVILGKSLRRRRRLIDLLKYAEDKLIFEGFKECFAYIYKTKEQMIRYAEKFGFKKTLETADAYYLLKPIGG